MARIKNESRTRTAKFESLELMARSMGETNDCSVKAVALACNVRYEDAHRALARQGRKNRRGSSTSAILRAIKSLGFTAHWIPDQHFINQYPKSHQILKGCTTHHPERFNKVWADGETYVMFTSCHVLTIVDGVNHDWTKGRAKRSQGIYQVRAA